jgi:hypothetical protein
MNQRNIVRLLIVIGLLVVAGLYTGGRVAAGTQAEAAVLSPTDGLPGARFLHVSTTSNVTGNSTYIDHPLTNGDPNAIVFVTKNINAGVPFGGGVINERVIGVWYDTGEQKWAIFNQDGVSMAAGSFYNVLIPDVASGVFAHQATAGNINGHWTYVDHPQANNNPDALLFINQNWNPGGTGGTYNDHPVGVWYDNIQDKWAIFNEDVVAMPVGAAFNVLITEAGPQAFVHYATAGNINTITSTSIERPNLDADNHALLFVTQNWNPGGTGGVYNEYGVSVAYNPLFGHWSIGNLEPGMTVSMTVGAAFNVLYVDRQEPFFVHQATAGNSSGNSTFLDHPFLNDESNAVTLVTQNWNPGGAGGVYNAHPVGVWYSGTYDQWLAFNRDGASIPQGASFNVFVPNLDAGAFVHKAVTDTINNNSTFIEHPWTDGDPEAVIFVTQNWNPGGVGGVYNVHPVGVWYNDLSGQWAVFNEDGADMPEDASFNVFVPISDTNVFVHEATAGNSSGNSTYLDHPLLNGHPESVILITQNWNPGGGLSGTYNPYPVGVWYSAGSEQWAIFNQDGTSMPVGAAFNVLVLRHDVYLPLVLRDF